MKKEFEGTWKETLINSVKAADEADKCDSDGNYEKRDELLELSCNLQNECIKAFTKAFGRELVSDGEGGLDLVLEEGDVNIKGRHEFNFTPHGKSVIHWDMDEPGVEELDYYELERFDYFGCHALKEVAECYRTLI